MNFPGLDANFEAAVPHIAVLQALFSLPIYLRGGDRSEQYYILNTLSVGMVLDLIGRVLVRTVY